MQQGIQLKKIHEASHVIAYIVNHRKTLNIIVTIIDTFSAGNSCMSIIGNLRYILHVCSQKT